MIRYSYIPKNKLDQYQKKVEGVVNKILKGHQKKSHEMTELKTKALSSKNQNEKDHYCQEINARLAIPSSLPRCSSPECSDDSTHLLCRYLFAELALVTSFVVDTSAWSVAVVCCVRIGVSPTRPPASGLRPLGTLYCRTRPSIVQCWLT